MTEHKTFTSVTALTQRSGDWWAISVPEIDGMFTQTKRLDQVAATVQEAAALLGYRVQHVHVQPQLSEQDGRTKATRAIT